jgi:peptidoglycan/LPS O-acetylase OafA/YrhL
MGLMRFLLAMAVVVGHMGPSGAHFALIPGTLAVEVFFAISGFYMSLILTGKYRDRTTFYVNRFLRLYPVYFIVILATWAWFLFTWIYLGKLPTNSWVEAYGHMSSGQVASLVISNWTMVGLDIPSVFHFKADAGFLFFHFPDPVDAPDGAKWAGEFRTIGQAWSIGVEIWFYLIAPFLVALRTRWIVLIGLASILLKSVMMNLGMQTYFFFPAQLCFFMAGMLLHRGYAANLFVKLDRRVGYAALTVVVALLVFYERLPQLIADYVIYAALIPAIPILFHLTRKSRFDFALGNLSYPIYVVHLLIISMAFAMLHHANVELQGVTSFAIILAVLVASTILYFVVEKPVDEVRQRRATHVMTCSTSIMAEPSNRAASITMSG